MPKLIPLMIGPDQRRELIHQKVMEGLKESFPIQSRNKTIEVDDLYVTDKEYSPSQQKRAILTGDSLFESVKGTVRMKDKDGKVLDEVKDFTLVRVPYFTPRHTFIIGGNEHSVSNMVRRKPGIYARKRANGILEAGFNTLGGANFRISMDPEKGQPQLEYQSTKIPLYPILRSTGMSHEEIAKAWGPKLADANAKALGKKTAIAVNKLYEKEVPAYARDDSKTTDEKSREIVERFRYAKMDPVVNLQTVGRPHDHVSPQSLLDASAKVLRIFNNQAEVDDQDNLGFKTILSVDDFFKERIKLHAREVARKASIKAEMTPTLKKALPPAPFTKDLLQFIGSSTLASIPDQTNPVDLIDSAMRVTSLGEGGISTERAIPIEARQTHVTQIGALDPIRTPESMRAGIDIRAAVTAQRDENGDIYVPVYDVKTKREKYIKAGELQNAVVMFSNQEHKGKVDAVDHGVVRRVPFGKVDYAVTHQSRAYSPTTNLIPFLESAQGNRAVMGSKMQVQALSLVDREAPYVQVATPSGRSFEEMIGRIVNPYAPVGGTVKKIDDDYIYIQPDKVKTAAAKPELVKVPYDKDFPLAAKTYLNHHLEVKPGDKVSAGQRLGDSNFTRGGTLALGKNMSVAYMPYYGANSNDAIVVSDAAAKKLTSERMYKIVIPRDPDLTFNANKHKTYYGHNYTKDQYHHLDEDGVIRPGSKLLPGDPAVVGVRKVELSPDDVMLGRLHRSLAQPFREFAQGWDHDHEGEVVDVVKTPKRITLTVKTKEPALVGDKLCYTRDTEVLTVDGWVAIEEVTYRTQCYTLNAAGEIELHTPAGLHHYDNAGELYELKSQQVVLRVTPNHHLYVCPRYADKFELVEARNAIGKRVRHKKDGAWVSGVTPPQFVLPTIAPKQLGCKPRTTEGIDTLAWCRFLGAYLANGSYTIRARKDRDSVEYCTTVHTIQGQRHSVSGDQHTWVGEMIAACGFTGQKRPDRWLISSRQLTEYLSQFGHAQTKHIPPEIFSWGADAARACMEGLLGCDGNLSNSNSLSYATISKQLADDVQRLALHAGWAANVKTRKVAHEGWSDRYEVRIVRSKLTPQVNYGHARTQAGQEERIVKSSEPVWGITVPNHTLYVRVQGVSVWSGNSGRYGNKGVISEIVPTDQMIKDEAGNPVDIIMTSAGVVSRINPSQIIESAVGKVVEKTGKPIVVENFTGRDNVQWAKQLLKENKIKDKEKVHDPRSGKDIPNVFVGRQYIYKLFKTTDNNYSARSIGSYDMNLQPTRGGVQGAKAVGKMEFDALLGHNARNILRETATVKSQKNDEFWRAVQLGYTPPEPKSTFAYDKFLGMLTGAGVRVHREGNIMSLAPLTDKDVAEMSSGEIKDAKIVRAKDLRPETGGLFDPGVTGGLRGTRWSHIELAEPVMNPIFKEPVRRLLGMTNAALDETLRTKGAAYIRKELKKIDLDAKEKELFTQLKGKKADQLDNELKQLKYIKALRAVGVDAGDAYIVSKVPVIPPVLRPVTPGKGGTQIIYGDANPLYQDLIYINNQLKEIKDPKTPTPPGDEEKLRPALQQAVGAVYGTDEPVTAKSKGRGHKGFLTYISGVGGPKHGYFHSKLMSRAQDVAGRGTVVPDVTLGIDEIGVPDNMLWTMYEQFVIRRLVQQGFPPLQAKQMVADKHPAAKEALRRETQERPVLMNRAPTLHRYNIVGARPVPVPGKTFRVNPFVEKLQNMDYDGDALTIHTPVSPAAVAEAKSMTLSNMLFGDKSKNDLLVFPQHEAIMGIHHATSVDDGNVKPRKFKTTADALAAYNRGEITLGTRVEIDKK